MSSIVVTNRMRCMRPRGFDGRWAGGRTGAGKGTPTVGIGCNPLRRGPLYPGRTT